MEVSRSWGGLLVQYHELMTLFPDDETSIPSESTKVSYSASSGCPPVDSGPSTTDWFSEHADLSPESQFHFPTPQMSPSPYPETHMKDRTPSPVSTAQASQSVDDRVSNDKPSSEANSSIQLRRTESCPGRSSKTRCPHILRKKRQQWKQQRRFSRSARTVKRKHYTRRHSFTIKQ